MRAGGGGGGGGACVGGCSDLPRSVFLALSSRLLHLRSHSSGGRWTKSVPLHVGHTRYTHLLIHTYIERVFVSWCEISGCHESLFVFRSQCMA